MGKISLWESGDDLPEVWPIRGDDWRLTTRQTDSDWVRGRKSETLWKGMLLERQLRVDTGGFDTPCRELFDYRG